MTNERTDNAILGVEFWQLKNTSAAWVQPLWAEWQVKWHLDSDKKSECDDQKNQKKIDLCLTGFEFVLLCIMIYLYLPGSCLRVSVCIVLRLPGSLATAFFFNFFCVLILFQFLSQTLCLYLPDSHVIEFVFIFAVVW